MLLLLLSALLQAQYGQKQLDSLHLALKNAANDTVRMHLYAQLGVFYAEVNHDSALFYSEKELSLAKQLKLKIDEAGALDFTGYILYQLGNYPKSLESFLQALKIAEDLASEKSSRHLSDGQIPRAQLRVLASIHHDLGHLYGRTGNINKQISNYLETKSIAESIHDTLMLALVDWNLGSTYWKLDKLDSALFLEQKALAIFSNSTDRKYEGAVLNLIGDIYLRKGDINLSRDALLKSVQINEEQNNLSFIGHSYISLASLYQTVKKPDSSLLYARKGLESFKAVWVPSGMAGAYSLLSSIYSGQNKTDSALANLKLATAFKDSLNDAERKKLSEFQNLGFNEQMRLEELEKEKIKTQTKIRTYAMLAGIGVFMLIALILYKNNRNRRKANDLLLKKNDEIERQKINVEQTLTELRSTQAQLIQSEKMASLGELTAGIAHEIQNPLNFVNNFSEVNNELIEEASKANKAGNPNEVSELLSTLKDNEEKINHHGKRAEAIVKGMLQHSRASIGHKEPTDINALADEYLRLSYHGLRAKDKSFNAILNTDFDERIGKINIIPPDIGRVLLNLYNNAFYAVTEEKKQAGEGYEPTISVTTKKLKDKVEIRVKDNGSGIPRKVVDKIFQPFFTTKPTGQGTGLGLSLSYDIIKVHGGEINVETKEGELTEFVIHLPISV